MAEVETFPIVSRVELNLDQWDRQLDKVGADAGTLAAEMDKKIGEGLASLEAKLTAELGKITAAMASVEAANTSAAETFEQTGDVAREQIADVAATSAAALQESMADLGREFEQSGKSVEGFEQGVQGLGTTVRSVLPSLKELEKDALARIEDRLDSAAKSVGRAERSIDGLGQQSVRQSKWMRDAFGPGGGFQAVSEVGRMFHQFGEAVGDASVKLRTGELGINEAIGAAARGIPILGDFVEGWDGLREAVHGTNAAIINANAEFARSASITSALLENFQAIEQVKRQLDTELKGGDTDDDLAARIDRAKDKVEQNRLQEKKKLLEDYDEAKRVGDQGRADTILAAISNIDKVSEIQKKKLDDELRRGLIQRQQRRAEEGQANRGRDFEDPYNGPRAAGFREAGDKVGKEAEKAGRDAAQAELDRQKKAAEDRKKAEAEQKRVDQEYARDRFRELEQSARGRIGDIDDQLRALRQSGVKGDAINALVNEKAGINRTLQEARVDVNLTMDADQVQKAVTPVFKQLIDQRFEQLAESLRAEARKQNTRRGM